jgi:hypothetical protein
MHINTLFARKGSRSLGVEEFDMSKERGEHWKSSGCKLVEIVEKAIEALGIISKDHRLILDESLPN